jgi:phage shock protein A
VLVETDAGVYGPTMPDAQFIAAARTDIPALLAYIEELKRERDEARKILEETIEYCEKYIWELAQTKEELIMLQEHERSRNAGRTLDQISDDLSWEDAYRRGLLEGSKAVELEHKEALLELERWRNGTTIEEDFASPRDFEADKLLRKLLFGAPTQKNTDENP